MPTVAEQLRTAREAAGLSVNEVAEVTKIRTDHIRALDTGNYDVFVAPVYIRGFVRSYASLVKLDVPRVMATLEGELGRTDKFAEPPSLTGRPRTILDFLTLQLSRVDWRRALIVLGGLALLGLLVAAYLGWQQYRRRDPLADVRPAVYQPARPVSGDTLPLPAPKR